MLLQVHHFDYNWQKHAECVAECEEAVVTGELTREEADYLCDIERFAPFMEKADSLCFLCGKKLTIPCIMWHGSHGEKSGDAKEIFLHIQCCAEIIESLRLDVVKAKNLNLLT